jgi:hypothetical protein
MSCRTCFGIYATYHKLISYHTRIIFYPVVCTFYSEPVEILFTSRTYLLPITFNSLTLNSVPARP